MTFGDVIGLVAAVMGVGAAVVVVTVLTGLRRDLRGLAGAVEQVGAAVAVAEPRVVVVDHRTLDVDSGPVTPAPIAGRPRPVRAIGAAPAALARPLAKVIALGTGTTSAAQAFRRRRGVSPK